MPLFHFQRFGDRDQGEPLACGGRHTIPNHRRGGRQFTARPLEKALKIVPHVAVYGLFFHVSFSKYQRYVGIRGKEVDRLHNEPFSGSLMPSLPPCDGNAPFNGTCIRTNFMPITVVGLPCGSDDPDNIVPRGILSFDIVDSTSINNIVILLPPTTT